MQKCGTAGAENESENESAGTVTHVALRRPTSPNASPSRSYQPPPSSGAGWFKDLLVGGEHSNLEKYMRLRGTNSEFPADTMEFMRFHTSPWRSAWARPSCS